MPRAWVLPLGLIVAGCGPGRDAATPADDADPLPGFGAWPTATPGPIPIEPRLWTLCEGPRPDQFRALQEKHGPHFRPTIVVRVSPEAVEAFRAGRPLPVGAVVVKEKHPDEQVAGPPPEYAAMVKPGPGYDPEHGDWEYVSVDPAAEPRVARGRLTSCIDCHSNAKDGDYLFRAYLPKNP